MKYPIYVPSKGRPSCRTAKLIADEGIDFKVVVEPQDAASYIEVWGDSRIAVMPENDQGIHYARNFCKRDALSHKHSFHWQLDDDLQRFTKVGMNKKLEKCTAYEAMRCTEKFVDSYTNIMGAGIASAAFFPKKPYLLNQQVYTVVLINTKIDCWWRAGCIEDTDFSLQMLTKGYCTLLMKHYQFAAPTTGTESGGCNTEAMYAGDGRTNKIRGLQRNWRELDIGMRRGVGLPKAKTAHIWRKFKQVPKK